jgi:hypothetical protein
MNTQKKYAVLLALFFLILLTFSGIYYQLSMNNIKPVISYDPLHDEPIDAELLWIRNTRLKKDQQANIKQNKILFNGGSNVLFGIHTLTISRELKVPVLNMGIHAGLGLDYILNHSKKVLKSGDILVLPLEYTLYVRTEKVPKLAFDYYRTFGGDEIKQLSFTDKAQSVLKEDPVKNTLTLFKNLLPQEEIKANLPAEDGWKLYRSIDQNEYGDQTGHNHQIIHPLEPMSFPNELSVTMGMKMILEFNEWCKENEIVLFINFPTIPYWKVYESGHYKDYFDWLTIFFKDHNIGMLGTPYDFFYSHHLFYDTEYHLNTGGMSLRTYKIIELMQEIPEIQKFIMKNRSEI